MGSLLRTHSIDALIAASEEPERRLRKTLGPWSLTAFGIGAVIGSGIFTLTGTAAAGQTLQFKSILNAPILDLILNGGNAVSTIGRPGAGPGISLSFFVTAFVCGFAALCYAELASMIPIAGSAYTYAYATLGEIFAWIIGWDLILEYAVSNMSVAVGFSAYFNDLLDDVFHVHLPKIIANPAIVNGGVFRERLQSDRAGDSADPDLGAGARRPGERAHQQRHGADQDRGDPDLRHRRGARR